MILLLRILSWMFLSGGGLLAGICFFREGLLWMAAIGLIFLALACLSQLEDLEKP